jgi:prolyl-tRNA synthetase
MRWSQTFIPTLKEAPAEAELVSHQLLLRAGLVRKLGAGLYTFLPLGLRALRKVEQIIREEMNRAGALEVFMPALQPPEIWRGSGRYVTAREVLYRVRDRANREWVLGPTHEEVITTLAASEITSYRQLPKSFYQIQTKFRDEIRPRFGLLRAREFIMKDAYSFDATDAAAQLSYQKMFAAYGRIFRRCGLRTMAVEAAPGVIGGNFSHEFMAPADGGEDQVAACDSGQYAANLEKATSQGPLTPTPKTDTGGAPELFPTPGVLTIEGLSRPPYNVPAERQIKTLVYLVESRLTLLLLRGDDQLNEAKLAGALGGGEFRPAVPAEILPVLGAHPGSLGAVAARLGGPGAQLPVVADLALQGAAGMVTGANQDGFHVRHVNIGRDLKVSQWADLRTVKPGELCVSTGRPLSLCRAIEVGHLFMLGAKYSRALNAFYLDGAGVKRPCVMACYGLGVTRTLQAIIEQCNDKDGIIWPLAVAPFAVCITPLSVTPGSPALSLAEQLHADLAGQGVEALLDDRDERPGVKFKDADLIGLPLRVTLGEKSLARGQVELKPRAGAAVSVEAGAAVAEVLAWLRAEDLKSQM